MEDKHESCDDFSEIILILEENGFYEKPSFMKTFVKRLSADLFIWISMHNSGKVYVFAVEGGQNQSIQITISSKINKSKFFYFIDELIDFLKFMFTKHSGFLISLNQAPTDKKSDFEFTKRENHFFFSLRFFERNNGKKCVFEQYSIIDGVIVDDTVKIIFQI